MIGEGSTTDKATNRCQHRASPSHLVLNSHISSRGENKLFRIPKFKNFKKKSTSEFAKFQEKKNFNFDNEKVSIRVIRDFRLDEKLVLQSPFSIDLES